MACPERGLSEAEHFELIPERAHADRRLRLNGLIRWLQHTNRYVLTPDGIRIAVFCTKVCNRLLVPLTAANQSQAPPDLRAALAAITRHVDEYVTRARLSRAA